MEGKLDIKIVIYGPNDYGKSSFEGANFSCFLITQRTVDVWDGTF